MNTRHPRNDRRALDARRPAHQPRPRPRAGAWQAFCRARRNAVQRVRAARPVQPKRAGYRQLALGLPAAVFAAPVERVVAPHRPLSRRVRRHRPVRNP